MVLDDDTIASLVAEPKPQLDPGQLHPVKEKRGHYEGQVQVEGRTGSKFRVIVRQLRLDPFDFSVILGYDLPGTNRVFRLRRHNGLHTHTNKLEHESFTGFHVHVATERYQLEGFREDAYATQTDRYADLGGAIEDCLAAASFDPPAQTTLRLP